MKRRYPFIVVLSHLIKKTLENRQILENAKLSWNDKPRRVSKLCYRNDRRDIQYFESFSEAAKLKKFHEFSYVILAEDFKELSTSTELLSLQAKARNEQKYIRR